MPVKDSLLIFLIKHNIRGKDRLVSLLIKLGFNKGILFKAKYGIKLYLNPREYIDNTILKEGFYESEITDALLAQLQNGGTFWDIGANIGIHSIAVKKNLPDVKVYSFEPNPKTLSVLLDNVKLNKLDINICGFALFDTVAPMQLFTTEGNSGMATLTPWHETRFESTVQCLTTTGDILMDGGFEPPTAMKLDTEGAELNVLKGCTNILVNPNLQLILIEAANDLVQNADTNEIALFLKQFGFDQIKLLVRNENTAHGLSNFAITRG